MTKVYEVLDVWGKYSLAVSGRVVVLTDLSVNHPRGFFISRQQAADIIRFDRAQKLIRKAAK